MPTMKILFDSQHNPIPPTLILANRSGNRLGYITNVDGIHVSDALSDTPELSFKVHKFSNGNKCHLWDKIVDFKLVYCKEWNTWFQTKVEVADTEETVKSVSCLALCQAELSQILLFGIEINTEDDIAREDYKIPTTIYNEENPEASLLNRISEKIPHYKIKHVDDSLKKIQRTFSFDNKSIKDALDEIAEEINCLVVYGNELDEALNAPARTISLYDLSKNCIDCGYRGEFSGECPECGSSKILEGFGRDTAIFVSKDNLTDEVNFSTDTDSVKNCFRLEAGDDLMTATVRNCNPNGSGYIWFISQDMKSDMSDELVSKIDSYDSIYEDYQKKHKFAINVSAISEYNKLIDKYKKFNKELAALPSSIIGYANLMNALYEVIDFDLYLNDSLMPTFKMADTTAEKQVALLSNSSLSPVAVANLEALSAITADSYVLDAAKVIIDSRYQVKIKSSSFNKTSNVWSGVFTVTNYSDDEDTADSKSINISINDDYESYLRHKIEKALQKGDTKDYSISSLMKKSLTVSGNTFNGEFATAIKEYSLKMLASIHDCCQGCLDVLVEQGIGDKESWYASSSDLYEKFYLSYFNKLKAIEAEMKVRESEIEKINKLNDSIESERKKVHDALDFEKYLGEKLWKIFCSYRRDDVYKNSNYISDGLSNSELFKNALEFVNVANKELFKSATLQHSISTTLKNLLVIKEFEKLLSYFSVGNWIRVEVDGSIYRLRLISYDIDFDSLDSLNVDFSDVIKMRDGISDSQSIFDKISSMTTSYDSVKHQASNGNDANDKLDSWVEDGLDATNQEIVDSQDKNTVLDGHGILLRKYDDILGDWMPTQIKINHATMSMTSDNWKTVKCAVGNYYYFDPVTGKRKNAYGVNAETIIGRLILGENLGIYNADSSLTFDKNGLKVSNGKNSFVVNPSSNKLLALSNTKEEILYVDTSGILHIKGDGAGLDLSSNETTKGLDGRITQNTSKITQNANAITAEVKRAQDKEAYIDGRVTTVNTTLSSKITQTATEIKTEVSKKVGKTEIISQINQSAEKITIKANKISLEGIVTANSRFKVLTDGSIEAVGGKFSGEVEATSITAKRSYSIYGSVPHGTNSDSFEILSAINRGGNSRILVISPRMVWTPTGDSGAFPAAGYHGIEMDYVSDSNNTINIIGKNIRCVGNTAVSGNLDVSGNLTKNGERLFTDTGWKNVIGTSMATSYVTDPSVVENSLRIREKNGIVYLQGIFGLKNISNNVAILNLPEAYRPSHTFNHIDTGTGQLIYRTQFVSNGAVMFQWAYNVNSGSAITGDIGWVNLDVCFPTGIQYMR